MGPRLLYTYPMIGVLPRLETLFDMSAGLDFSDTHIRGVVSRCLESPGISDGGRLRALMALSPVKSAWACVYSTDV
jgi:hypothetical protein